MRLRIVHTTTHTYRGEVIASFNEARMTPLTLPDQTALDTRVEVSPPASVSRYWDYWGTHVTAFDLHAATTASSRPRLAGRDRPVAPGTTRAGRRRGRTSPPTTCGTPSPST